MKSNNLYLLLCCCVVLIAIIVRTQMSPPHDQAEQLARQELPVIIEAVELYQQEMKDFPPALLGSNDVSLYESLTGTNRTVRYLAENARWDKARKLIDPWTNEYRFEVFNGTNRDGTQMCQLKVWSCGPAGKDELGKGDNIELVRTWRKQ